jgi:mRNA-degrading endonuclease RelE of RelBE toxin-antitoxin system
MPLKRLIRLNRFVRAFDDLDADIQKIAEKQFHFFIENPFHPSLHTEKIDKAKGIYASRITDNVRFTWQFGEEKSTVVLRNVGEHNKVLKRKGGK